MIKISRMLVLGLALRTINASLGLGTQGLGLSTYGLGFVISETKFSKHYEVSSY